MIKGFEIFTTRDNYLVVENSKYPFLYNIFYSTFEVGQGKLNIPGVYLEQINQVAGILEQSIDSDIDFLIYDFLSIEESQIFIQNSYEVDDNILQKFYPIAECDSNKTLLVGVDKTNYDEIYIENINLFSDGTRYKFLASNIFEFISKIGFKEIEHIGYGIYSYKALYKEWGEGFWRVKSNPS